jgi:hypothetical protein
MYALYILKKLGLFRPIFKKINIFYFIQLAGKILFVSELWNDCCVVSRARIQNLKFSLVRSTLILLSIFERFLFYILNFTVFI